MSPSLSVRQRRPEELSVSYMFAVGMQHLWAFGFCCISHDLDSAFLLKKEITVLPVLTPLTSAQIPLFSVSRGITSGSPSSSKKDPSFLV